MAIPGVRTDAPPATAEVVIVGAGIQGLALAYELTQRGRRDVVVLDGSWPGSGASGRNGEMVRSAFASREWCALFDLALRRWEVLSGELGANVQFTPAGYLLVAGDDAELARFRGWQAAQATYGLETRIVDGAEVRAIAPAIAPGFARGGLIQPRGGFAHHDAAVWAYAAAAARAGARIHAPVPATGIDVDSRGVAGVTTPLGRIATRTVVDAAGDRAAAVAALAGVTLPLRVMRLEAFVTESLRPFLRPAVSLPSVLGYCHQTTRGEFVGGTEQRVMPDSDSRQATIRSLRDACQKFVRVFPLLAGARVVRQWAGNVSYTDDLAPVLGAVPELPGLHVSAGWVYGFMGAPGAAVLLAEALTASSPPPALAPFRLDRLRTGDLIAEGSLVVAAPVAS
jgi:sarcosine oxidase subunit beta